MIKTKQQKVIKFPENRKLKSKLQPGDRDKIAEWSGLSVVTIRDIINGYRRITDDVARAIIRLFEERDHLNSSLQKITNQ